MSLFESLTKAAANSISYPATAVSKALIEIVAEDVCTFRRNTQVSYRIVEQFSAIRKCIEDLIKEVEEPTTTDWTAYDTYTEAIDPLEEYVICTRA